MWRLLWWTCKWRGGFRMMMIERMAPPKTSQCRFGSISEDLAASLCCGSKEGRKLLLWVIWIMINWIIGKLSFSPLIMLLLLHPSRRRRVLCSLKSFAWQVVGWVQKRTIRPPPTHSWTTFDTKHRPHKTRLLFIYDDDWEGEEEDVISFVICWGQCESK